MVGRQHHYRVALSWTGNTGRGTASIDDYSRNHVVIGIGKPPIPASSDAAFRGDPTRWNPEEMLLASLSSCHQLWYLALCAQNGILVRTYEDDAEGWMHEDADGAGQFIRVLLRPHASLAVAADKPRALELHREANAKCFIARSVNFRIEHEPRFTLLR